MVIDGIVAEVRQAREVLAQRCNYDLRQMIQGAKERQAASGRKVVSLPRRPIRKIAGTRMANAPLHPTGTAVADSEGSTASDTASATER
ncbi:MAG: hypothetical protein ACRELF_10605 [Gemmataceae bacterium]